MLWLILLAVAVLALTIGYATGSLCTLLYGTAAAVKMARLRLKEDAEDQAVEDDEESRLDALAVRDLIHIGDRIFNSSKAGFALSAENHADLAVALHAAEKRFADWIDWAEGATATKTALAAPERDEVTV